MSDAFEVQPVPGVVGVILGCPDGCGETFPVLAWKDDIQTPPASQGCITATVRLTAGVVAAAYAQHIAEHHG